MSKANDFTVIPALDLKDGVVVHAKAGPRAEYRPLESPFGQAGDPVAIARGLLAVTGSPVLYIADLDAIEGSGSNFDLCAISACPSGFAIWIDAGFSNVADCAFWLPLGATLVIGSESLKTADDWQEITQAFGESLMLSLDFDAEGPRGPGALFADPDLWPERVIAMSLDRVGTGQGPTSTGLPPSSARAGRAVYAAGGIRNGRSCSRCSGRRERRARRHRAALRRAHAK